MVIDVARLRDSILAHARRCDPGECVGLLIDAAPGAIELTNIDPEPLRRFRMDEAEVARFLCLPIAGMYHSHPGGDVIPSWEDRQAPLARGWRYWIVEPRSGRFGYWIWDGQDFVPG